MSAVRFQNRPPHGNQSVSFLPSSSASVIRPTASSNRSPGLSAPLTSTFLISNFITCVFLLVIHYCNITKLFHSVQGNCKVFSFFFMCPFFRLFSSANDAFSLINLLALSCTTGCILCRNWIKSPRLSPGSSTPTRATQSFPRNRGEGADSSSLCRRAVTHCPYITYILFSPSTCAGDRLLAFLNSANSSLVMVKNLLSLIIFLCVCSFDNNFQPHGVK